MLGNRRDRSRSPLRNEYSHRRGEEKNQETVKNIDNNLPVINHSMMMANMYPQGNMMMAPSGMYHNMMLPSAMIGANMMPSSGIEMIQGTGMDLVSPAMDITAIPGSSQSIAQTNHGAIDISMMGNMLMDPAIMGMYPNMNTEMSLSPEKKEVVLKYCILSPPEAGVPIPPRRARPPGCRTIFVGGLPDKIRESTVREIFEMYGRIHTLRLSKKNFCHIRFDRESCVDAAMSISGYRVKLTVKENDKDDDEEEDSNAYLGWLHVDYALSRDDQNEYERRQRQALRAQQAQMQQLTAQQEMASRSTSASRKRSPSPLRMQPFSNTSMAQLADKIKSEEQFPSTLPTLISWLERGECSKKNSNQFYSMIQVTNSHIRRLFQDKMQAEEELQEFKERIKTKIQKVIDQLEQVAKVFAAATHQRAWDHFTKPQRKNIDTWHKMAQEFIILKEEFCDKFSNEDVDFNGYSNKISEGNNEEVEQLRRENESLSFQLEAYKNEVDVIKSDAQKEMEKFKAQFIARQALEAALEKNPPLPVAPAVKPPPPPPLPHDNDDQAQLVETVEAGCGEAKLIGVISAFLQVHPNGASLDYVVSYVRALFPGEAQARVHRVLLKHGDVFGKRTTGVGADIEHRWYFVAFNDLH